jgi:DNA-3-methyladenine glycosylase I
VKSLSSGRPSRDVVRTGKSTKGLEPSLRMSPRIEDEPLLNAHLGEEWSIPERDGRALWNALALQGFKAGFFWSIIPKKRTEFRRAFKEFDPHVAPKFHPTLAERLMMEEPVQRSRSRVVTAIGHPHALLSMERARSCSRLVWSFVNGRPIHGVSAVESWTGESHQRSDALAARGFKYVGPVVVYARGTAR